MDEMLEYIQIYATSVASTDENDKSSKKAMELYQYLKNNKEGLLPYDKRGINIPALEKGIHTQTDSIIICHCLKRCRRHQEKHLKSIWLLELKSCQGLCLANKKEENIIQEKQ